MEPTDEELMHAFYGGDTTALNQLSLRVDPILGRLAFLFLQARNGSGLLSLGEWDINERLDRVWSYVLDTRTTGFARWPHQRLSVLTWLIHILCLEMDRHLGFRPPF